MKAGMRYCERTAKAKLGGVERDRHDKDLRSWIPVSLTLQESLVMSLEDDKRPHYTNLEEE